LDWTGINEKLMDAVRGAHADGYPYLAGELHALMPVQSYTGLRTTVDRLDTVKTLIKLRPLKETDKKFKKALTALEKEVKLIIESLKIL